MPQLTSSSNRPPLAVRVSLECQAIITHSSSWLTMHPAPAPPPLNFYILLLGFSSIFMSITCIQILVSMFASRGDYARTSNVRQASKSSLLVFLNPGFLNSFCLKPYRNRNEGFIIKNKSTESGQCLV